MAEANSIGRTDRPDTLFIQSQYLPWEPHRLRGEGCLRRRLSQDAQSGDESFVMRLMPGYRLEGPVLLDTDFEFFVVYGEIEINGLIYHRYCYGQHPTGYAHNSFTSPQGATVIVITAGGPDALYRGAPKYEFKRHRLVERVDAWKMDWHFGADRSWFPASPHPAPQPIPSPETEFWDFAKVLWEDPDTKGHTFLYAGLPHATPKAIQNMRAHVVDLEYFVLEGDYIFGTEGRMTPGGYAFFKAGVTHGPYATEYGYLNLHKHYGIMDNVHFRDKHVEMDFDPPYRPTLPPELGRYGKPLAMPHWWD